MYYCNKCRCKQNPNCCCKEKFECKECPKYHDNIVVRDETVCCTEEVTYHHCVKQIVPVECKKIENHVYHHEYEVKKCYEKEERCCEVGKRKEDWCKYCDCHDEKRPCQEECECDC